MMPAPLASAMDGIAHGYCLLWDQRLLWLHAGADTVIGLAYFLIPVSLVRFIRQRRDIPFNSVFLCFGAFILLCGTTHLLGVWNIWVPDWWLSGGVKAATAGVSLATAGLLVKLLPQAIALPSPTQLREANERLEAANTRLRREVAEREAAQDALARAREDAEALVRLRTAELAEANASLVRSEARYRAVVQSTADFIWTVSPDGTPRDDAGWAAFTGFSEAELQEDRARFLHPDERDWVMRSWRHALESGLPFESQHRLVRPDGSWRHVRVTSVPVYDGEGTLQEWVGVHTDVSARVEADRQLALLGEQLQQSQRLEAVGRLAGGIAHDFNNLLTVITGAGSLVLEDLGPDHPARQEAEDVVAAGTRAAALTAQLLAYSRKQVLQPRLLDLNTVLTDVQTLLARLIGEQVHVRLAPAAASCPILADPNQMEQVILNLALNARDAMPTGGTLTFETERVLITDRYAATHLGMTPGEYVMLAVSDTGIGMDELTRAQIFEPFFTTKERGQGTGLGLATVYGIVRQSGGRIYVYSEPGFGTTFKLYFPQAVAEGEPVFSAPPPPLVSGGHETVLLVEDAEDVRLFVARVLGRAGYTVKSAENPAAALALLANEAGTIDLLLTDVIMPGMNGRELADQVVQLRPGISVLFMSGYTDNAIVHHGVLDPRTQFLHKPFTPDQLLMEVRRALASQGAPRGRGQGEGARPA